MTQPLSMTIEDTTAIVMTETTAKSFAVNLVSVALKTPDASIVLWRKNLEMELLTLPGLSTLLPSLETIGLRLLLPINGPLPPTAGSLPLLTMATPKTPSVHRLFPTR